jgi:hypothetical protein
MSLVTLNNGMMALYYAISVFFLVAVIRNFVKTRSPQEAILYSIIMMPFVLRILRLK